MVKAMKFLVFGAAALIALLVLTFLVLLAINGFRFSAISGGEFKTRELVIDDEVQNIFIKSKTVDIKILPSEDGALRAVLYEREELQSSLSVVDGTLKIEPHDTRAWYNKIFSFGSASITLYLPEAEYDGISVTDSTGDVRIEGTSAEEITVTVSTGDVDLKNIRGGSARITASTGDITIKEASLSGELLANSSTGDAELSDVSAGSIYTKASTGDAKLLRVNSKDSLTAVRSTGDVKLADTLAKSLSVTTSTGSVKLDKSDAHEIYVKVGTGNVSGSLLSSKVFITETDTGKVCVPKTAEGGRCEITTDTGNITITISEE